MWLSMGSPRKCSIPTTLLWQYSQHLSNLPRIEGIITMIALGIGPFQESMTLCEISRFIRRWGDSYTNGTIGVSVDGRTRSE